MSEMYKIDSIEEEQHENRVEAGEDQDGTSKAEALPKTENNAPTENPEETTPIPSDSTPSRIYRKLTDTSKRVIRAPRKPTVTVTILRAKKEVWDNVLPKWKPQDESQEKLENQQQNKHKSMLQENPNEKSDENFGKKPHPIIGETMPLIYIPLAQKNNAIDNTPKPIPAVRVSKTKREVWDLELPKSYPLAQNNPDAPAQNNPDAPAQSNLDTPAQTNHDTPAQNNLDAPAQNNLDASAQNNLDAPAQNNLYAPAQNNLDAPTQTNHDAPSQTNINAPALINLYAPLSVISSTPEVAKKRISVQVQSPSGRKPEIWDNVLPEGTDNEDLKSVDHANSFEDKDDENEVGYYDKATLSKPRSIYLSRSSYGFLRRFFFSFLDTFIHDCARHDLFLSQYPPVEKEDNSKQLGSELLNGWKNEQNSNPKNPRFYSVVFKKNRLAFFAAGIPYFLESIARISQAYVLGLLLDVLKRHEMFSSANAEVKDGIFGSNNNLLHQGCLWAAILSALMVVKYALSQYKFFNTSRIGMQLRISITNAIFEKSLKIASNTFSDGSITSLITNDLQKFEDTAQYFHFLWVGPIEFVIVTLLLIEKIGPLPALISMGFLLFLLIIQIILTISLQSFRKDIDSHRDARIETLSRMISSLISIKLMAWEDALIKKIEDIRLLEYGSIKKMNFRKSLCESIFFASSVAIPIIAFTLFKGVFTPSIVFSTCMYIFIVRQTMMNYFLKAIQFTIEFYSTLDRLQALFDAPELKFKNNTSLEEFQDPGVVIAMKDASFSRGSSKNSDGKSFEVICLQNISLKLRRGELTGVCGTLGSGKTALLHAIIGEVPCISGTIGIVAKNIAFVSQTPWIMAGTYRENITFGLPFRQQWFDEVIKACALDVDFAIFSEKENSKIDERGLNLSGGLKVRLSLARAVYSNADIYLLDDPFSAIDVKVSKHVFHNCIKTVLKKKTILLVTHTISFIQQCDQVILLENGQITASGTYQQVRNTPDSTFATALKQLPIPSFSAPVGKEIVDRQMKRFSLAKKRSIRASTAEEGAANGYRNALEGPQIRINSLEYLRIGASYAVIFLVTSCFLISQAFLMTSDFWLAMWTDNLITQTNSESLNIYIGFGVVTFLFSFFRAISYYNYALLSSEIVFQQMLYSVFHSHSFFIQKNSFGRIINRFAKDLADTDESFPQVSFDYFQKLLMVIGILIIIIVAVPWALLLYPFAIFTFFLYQRNYQNAIRRIKELVEITQSPIYTSVIVALEGKATIKAFKAEERIHDKFCVTQNDNTRVHFASINATRWFGMKVDGITCVFFVFITFFAVVLQNLLSLEASYLGLMLFYCLLLSDYAQDYVRQYAEVENLLTAASRTVEFVLDVPQESSDGDRPDDNWPEHGELTLSNLSLRYPGSDSDTLQSITAKIPAGKKTCIVGRTGAGKTSMIHSMFRLYEPTAESIVIDGVAISDLHVFYIRSRLALLPQEPVYFQGTLRFNLDPYSDYSDDKLWTALEIVHLKSKISNGNLGLEYPIHSNGENLSVGERQLLSIARALLRQPKVILLDEGTSSIDINSDKIFKDVLRNLPDVTIICVAHNLSSVIDYDQVLVLNRGLLVENGHPAQLLKKDPTEAGSWFCRMANMLSPEELAMIKGKLGI